MPNLYVLPGLLSCELVRTDTPTVGLWVSYPALILGKAGQMRLAANGIDPGPPDGVALRPGNPLKEYWETPLTTLAKQLYPHGYFVMPWVWDWRKSLLDSGELLAQEIRERESSADPCSIVAHSAGGLVTRAAWASLLNTNDQAKVRRIVTLCSPHQGTYAPVQFFSGDGKLLADLMKLTIIGRGLNFNLYPSSPFVNWTESQYANLGVTWPSLYELLPALDCPTAVDDLFRPMLFNKENWPGWLAIQTNDLDSSRTAFGPFLRAPESKPPAWVMTTVACTGREIAYRLTQPELLGTPAAYAETDEGDGIVTSASALMPAAAQYTLIAGHSDVISLIVNSGQLAQLVLDPRGPIDPTPPPIVSPTINAPVITDPPIAEAMGVSAPTGNCRNGPCRC